MNVMNTFTSPFIEKVHLLKINCLYTWPCAINLPVLVKSLIVSLDNLLDVEFSGIWHLSFLLLLFHDEFNHNFSVIKCHEKEIFLHRTYRAFLHS